MKRIVLIFIATACTALGLYAQPAPTYTLKSCLEQGLLNNYSLRIVRNEEQVSKNNATLGNAGYLPTLDLSAGYKGTIDNTETKARATGETTKDNGVFDQTLDAGINLNWTIFDGFNISTTYKELKELEAKEPETRTLLRDKVTEEEIARIVGRWTGIPVAKLMEGEREKLLHLEDTLHQRVIGQDEAVKRVSEAILRSRAGIQDPNRPLGSFLFLGPTGVGKTELSKALAEALFGDENAMVRIDMSEYMEKHSVSRMVGSPPGYVGYEEGGQLSEKVRRTPYSVVLFDEIEKASPEVFNILLQVLDDGHITDGQGRKVDFKNTVIIMTSNAGARSIAAPKRLGFTSVETPEQSYEMMKKGVMDEIKNIFKPEFLNRIDDIIVFHPLEKEEITRIVRLLTDVMAKRVKENMNITVSFTKKAIEKIAEEGYDKAYGARPLRRAIQSKIEDAFAEEYLLGNIKAGDKVSVGLKTNGFSFRVVK